MKAVLITQDDPFFLPKILPRLLKNISGKHQICGCILLQASPFGKRETFLQKAMKTSRIFGLNFFLRYGAKFVMAKLFTRNAIERLFAANGIAVIRLEQSINAKSSLDTLRALKPEILLSVAGNEIFKRDLIDLAPKGCLNLHTAELPRYRGLMPTFWVLRHGESHTAVSVFLVDEGIDSGPIVVQKRVPINGMTQEELIWATKGIGMDCIAEALDIMEKPKPLMVENNADHATYFGFPSREDVAAFRAAGAKFF